MAHRHGIGASGARALASALALVVALALLWPGPAPAAAESAARPGQDELAALEARVADLERERDALRARVELLSLELSNERAARIEREQVWLEYTRAVAALTPAGAGELPEFGPHLPRVEPAAAALEEPDAPSDAERARSERAAEVRAGLRSLLFQAALRSADLLEVGSVRDGWTGPVVFRLLDERGRLSGSLFAERLRLEASRAGRTVTLVLEDGHESHGGERSLFGSAAAPEGPAPWRITLQDLDPEPWLESLPELFGELQPEILADDGHWDLDYVRASLNRLLREDTAAGWYRLRRLGGVQAGILRDVHVEHLTSEGRLRSRLFADRLVLAPAARGVVLVFESGVRVRGDEKSPFLDGRQRVFLPRARQVLWREAGLPGFVEAPEGPAAAAPPARARERR